MKKLIHFVAAVAVISSAVYLSKKGWDRVIDARIQLALDMQAPCCDCDYCEPSGVR